jgi:hypothetical protein
LAAASAGLAEALLILARSFLMAAFATGELGFTLVDRHIVCYLHCFEVYIFNDGRTNKQKIDTSHRKV